MKALKKTLKNYFIIVFLVSLIIFAVCGILVSQEKGKYIVFGEEAETIQLSAEEIGTELRKMFDF